MRRRAGRGVSTRRYVMVALTVLSCLAVVCWLIAGGGGLNPAAPSEHDYAADGPAQDKTHRRPTGGDGSADISGDEDDGVVPPGLEDALGQYEWTSCTEEAGAIEQVARELLVSYRDSGDGVLVQAGYLDLFGSVWSCVVYGGDWADVCVVGEMDSKASCQVRVLHLTAEELRDLVEQDAL